ncbi:hypothetical protein Tco_0023697, partial [Tanacetum coccineum]
DETGVILTDKHNDFLFADASRMEGIEELSANICLMARIQPADNTSDVGPSYDYAFISKVQSSSITNNQEQIGNIEKDTHVPNLYALNKENVNDVNVANAAKAKTLLCVSCMQNVLIPCHDKSL